MSLKNPLSVLEVKHFFIEHIFNRSKGVTTLQTNVNVKCYRKNIIIIIVLYKEIFFDS